MVGKFAVKWSIIKTVTQELKAGGYGGCEEEGEAIALERRDSWGAAWE